MKNSLKCEKQVYENLFYLKTNTLIKSGGAEIILSNIRYAFGDAIFRFRKDNAGSMGSSSTIPWSL